MGLQPNARNPLKDKAWVAPTGIVYYVVPKNCYEFRVIGSKPNFRGCHNLSVLGTHPNHESAQKKLNKYAKERGWKLYAKEAKK